MKLSNDYSNFQSLWNHPNHPSSMLILQVIQISANFLLTFNGMIRFIQIKTFSEPSWIIGLWLSLVETMKYFLTNKASWAVLVWLLFLPNQLVMTKDHKWDLSFAPINFLLRHLLPTWPVQCPIDSSNKYENCLMDIPSRNFHSIWKISKLSLLQAMSWVILLYSTFFLDNSFLLGRPNFLSTLPTNMKIAL